MKAAPLAGMWAAERFGLADVQVLKLLEALPGGLQSTVIACVCVCDVATALAQHMLQGSSGSDCCTDVAC